MELGQYEKELCQKIRKLMLNDDDYIGFMFFLCHDRNVSEANCKAVLNCIEKHPDITRDELHEIADKIVID